MIGVPSMPQSFPKFNQNIIKWYKYNCSINFVPAVDNILNRIKTRFISEIKLKNLTLYILESSDSIKFNIQVNKFLNYLSISI